MWQERVPRKLSASCVSGQWCLQSFPKRYEAWKICFAISESYHLSQYLQNSCRCLPNSLDQEKLFLSSVGRSWGPWQHWAGGAVPWPRLRRWDTRRHSHRNKCADSVVGERWRKCIRLEMFFPYSFIPEFHRTRITVTCLRWNQTRLFSTCKNRKLLSKWHSSWKNRSVQLLYD